MTVMGIAMSFFHLPTSYSYQELTYHPYPHHHRRPPIQRGRRFRTENADKVCLRSPPLLDRGQVTGQGDATTRWRRAQLQLTCWGYLTISASSLSAALRWLLMFLTWFQSVAAVNHVLHSFERCSIFNLMAAGVVVGGRVVHHQRHHHGPSVQLPAIAKCGG